MLYETLNIPCIDANCQEHSPTYGSIFMYTLSVHFPARLFQSIIGVVSKQTQGYQGETGSGIHKHASIQI